MNSNHNNTKYYNYHPIPVKVIYCIKDRIINEKQFYLNSAFYSILHYFDTHLKEEGKTRLKKGYTFNNRIININEPLSNFITLKKNSSSSTIESVEILIEVEQVDNIGDEHLPYFEVLIQPKANPFGIYVYKIKEGLINLRVYPDKFLKKFELDKFSDFSAYCNSPKFLFISGGKLNDVSINDFWIINNQKYKIKKTNMPIVKSNHSMIYINLNNNESIFIAGGDNNLSTLYYNIKLNSFEIWGNMNSINIKLALYQYNNYLYSFSSLNDYDYYFERIDLLSKEHKWEKIYPIFDNDILNLNFKTQSFGVSSCINECILLVGGENIKNNSLIYNPVKNFLTLSKKGKNESILLSDKLFYKVNKYHNVALPSTLNDKKQIAVVNKMKQTVRLINFNKSDGISKVKFIQNELGKITVNTKIHERLRFEIQPEIVSAQNLTISKMEPKFEEKEIMKVEFTPKINENKIYEKAKITKKKKYLYLSSSVVYNNLIELLVENNTKNTKNNSFNNKYNNYKSSGFVEQLHGDRDGSLDYDFEEIFKNAKLEREESNEIEEDKRQIRDLFEDTIKEPLDHDIILIEDYYNSYYDINNFADYEIPK